MCYNVIIIACIYCMYVLLYLSHEYVYEHNVYVYLKFHYIYVYVYQSMIVLSSMTGLSGWVCYN
jgi:hypothetical protein